MILTPMPIRSRVPFAVLVCVLVTLFATGQPVGGQRPAAPALIDVTVTEGTSMSVAVSPDGRTLAIDLQGSIWTLPSAGGPARRVTGVFNDARQPTWSPDGTQITFFAFRDGNYDIWTMAPDGSTLRRLTWGAFDDREPAWSPDGTRLAFSSDRGSALGSDYNIWTLDVVTGALTRVTSDAADDFMPTWSPDGTEIAFASTRVDGQVIRVVRVADGVERQAAASAGVRFDAPSWGPGRRLLVHASTAAASRFDLDGVAQTANENVFAFRASWAGPTTYYYVSDGRIRRRTLGEAVPATVPFTATLQVTRAEGTYARRPRDFTSTSPRPVKGIVRPVISPDGTQVAFAAVGDIWVMRIGAVPVNLTNDQALDTDPAWSPDGTKLVYSSDKGSTHLQLWIRDLQAGTARQVTSLTTQPLGASWSPDGTRIAFIDVDGMWRVAQVSVLDVASGTVRKIHDTLAQPGTPTWSPDGTRVALAQVVPFSRRFREGTNQVLTISTTGGADQWYAPAGLLSIDSRGGCGPVWSPDGTKMAAIYEGVLSVWSVSRAGEPLGPPRRVTSESAHAPSWMGDSNHLLYQSLDALRIVNIETGESQVVPLDLAWTPDIPVGQTVVHAGTLLDMTSAVAKANMDVVIDGNRITRVVPHDERLHGGARVVDASSQVVMPGLVEFHSHLQKDFGEAAGRAWLAFGITTIRSPGNTPYEAVEDREANEAGVRPGPRVYATGFLMEWQRVFYKMGIAISSPAHLEMELERARVLEHDLIKSYVRLPDLQQKRMVEFAHGIGVPVATHEIFPAALVGVDNTEHTGASSRRGYSPKIATLQRSYDDVVQLFGKSGRTLCPMISGGGVRRLLADDPALTSDPRLALYPQWMRDQVERNAMGNPGGGGDPTGGSGRMVVDVMRAGGLIVAGTDTPNGLNLHGELLGYTLAGMTPFEALQTATVNPARALGLDAGTIEAGKLADLIVLDANPLVRIANTLGVRTVVANGRVFTAADLVRPR